MKDELDQRHWFRATGRVQGVGYRAFAQEVADNLGLTGWVRNDSDGSVEGEVQGSPQAIEQFVVNLQQGPCFSSVRGVEHHKRPGIKAEQAFHVRY